ncbi:AAA family ATPase [Candidatus Xianfuyuplasma coldseepsis]|uniref:Nuclease SbcCD subunit C n=1 Tax=Candidatus Xianfuyuplasma coldseepsis TaxID=2782163 RepID=A0A7L7KRR8_9MOLU|nr:AAA family ATPase [Xianfuyuplasma coldseepsis]QMS85109.1 hypothetical protein G4Z02_04910 [Xianfuyuplasma coldseepsis]
MIFKYIRLQNFRQYKGDHEFSFTQPDSGQKMTLIIAKNGVGKTTFVQAFRYCFYGSSANYLKLPRADDLLNNSLMKELKQLDTVELGVEVAFIHKDIDYIARRSQVYQKKNNKMNKFGEESFTVLYQTDDSGLKSLDKASSEIRIWQILPPGLSHVFMFDGERMEKRIESNEFKKELKESILGILDLKKLDYLIKFVGSEVKSRSILGVLNNKIDSKTKEEREIERLYKQYKSRLEVLEVEKIKIDDRLEEIEVEKKKYRAIQKEIEDHQKDISKLEILEGDLRTTEKELNNLGEKYLLHSGKAIINKLLLSQKKKYDEFIEKKDSTQRFFQYLHVDTLSDILKRKECVCGTKILEHSNEEKCIQELFLTALPVESAHHLNRIADTFRQTVNFKEQFDELELLKLEIVKQKGIRRKTENNKKVLEEKVRQREQEMGESTQINIDDLEQEKDELTKKLGQNETLTKQYTTAFKRKENERNAVLRKSEKNVKVKAAMDDINKIKDKLIQMKAAKDQQARNILSKHFNGNLSNVIQGDYSVEINDKYSLSIYDNAISLDVTDIMSTGQSVVISLSFIKSLIETAETLSLRIDKSQSYGVIMDAALSNVDETHINNLCTFNLNKLSQLVFLSFKRQLRNEMYEGIKNNIGKAYSLEKIDNQIISSELELTGLDEFIHEMEENNG